MSIAVYESLLIYSIYTDLKHGIINNLTCFLIMICGLILNNIELINSLYVFLELLLLIPLGFYLNKEKIVLGFGDIKMILANYFVLKQHILLGVLFTLIFAKMGSFFFKNKETGIVRFAPYFFIGFNLVLLITV